MIKIIIAVLLAFVLLLVVYGLRRRKATAKLQPGEVYAGETLELEQVVQWFQQQLNEHPEYKRFQALLLKPDAEIFRKAGIKMQKKYPHKLFMLQGIFDKVTETMPAAREIYVNRVAGEINEMFGDKSIVVFT